MKAVQLERPEALRYVDVPEPEAPGPGDAVVRVHCVGMCGTDYSGFLGKMPFFSYPRIPGHELGVEVVAVGPDVAKVKVGDHCSVEPYINCQKCYSCERGHTNCCETNKTLGVMCDGGMTERIILPARKMHPSKKLSFDQLALVETLAIGCHAVNRGEAVVLHPELAIDMDVLGAHHGLLGIRLEHVVGQAHHGELLGLAVELRRAMLEHQTEPQISVLVGLEVERPRPGRADHRLAVGDDRVPELREEEGPVGDLAALLGQPIVRINSFFQP